VRLLNGEVIYSATDLVRFADCRHHTALDLIDLRTPLEKTENDAQAKLLGRKGDEHEHAYLQNLRTKAGSVVEIDKEAGLEAAIAQTETAMKAGAEVIFQATLRRGQFAGHVDFLIRSPGSSKLGDYGYEVVDTKLARSEKAKFLVQVGLYSDMLLPVLGRLPERVHVQLGTGERISYRVADYIHYIRTLQVDFLEFATRPASTYPDKVAYCGMCQWRGLCEERREKDDHLSGVAGMSRPQIKKLDAAGVGTVADLARLTAGTVIPKLAPETLEKLRRQASQQVDGRKAGKPTYTLLKPFVTGKGLARLPERSQGDVYFDFEGDPLHEDGLEYLFGVGYFEDGEYQFMPIWAHDRPQERVAFDKFMGWLGERLAKYPDLHIYHYADYEVTALKRLTSLHGLHEAMMDQLLREHRFVDLYKVVKEGLVVSEPSYSLKNVEHFFMRAREGDVADAGASIVYYERWRETKDESLLKSLEEYNRFDVEATRELLFWLHKVKPADFQVAVAAPGEDAEVRGASEKVRAHEERLAKATEALRARHAQAKSDDDRHFLQLSIDLLDFYRRTEKPGWWAWYERSESDAEQLLDDMECIASCEQVNPADAKKIFPDQAGTAYRYPGQEFKLKAGDKVCQARTLEKLGSIEAVSHEHRAVLLKPRSKKFVLPSQADLGADGPVPTDPLRAALFRFADALAPGSHPYRAVEDLLRRRPPRLKSRRPGEPIIRPGSDVLTGALEATLDLDDSLLFIQGPPGCGKTYTASHLIVELLRRGKTIGVSSNSHKAIDNLLEAVEKRAKEQGVKFRGCKRAPSGRADAAYEGDFISPSSDVRPDAACQDLQLVAGTVYFFATKPVEEGTEQTMAASRQPLDYLFIDEAGQVSLAHAIVMGMRARNIVLVGDQMQLGQPTPGVHPGHSGESTLDYLLDGHATVAPDKGVLLEETWRMHPDVCQFISDAVYDGRLRSHPSLANQALVLREKADLRLKPTGLVYVPVEHQGCAQRSEEEAEVIADLYRKLMAQSFRDKHAAVHPMEPKNVLVVAPYNAQVNRLKEVLPDGARVGTVDKFQGQEAEVVLISMATSNAETLPRNIEFLFSRNRLNVAISRARCLSVLVCSPALLRIPCSTPAQMALVNTLDWFAAVAQPLDVTREAA
jgi:predicted RecB family nuclease